MKKQLVSPTYLEPRAWEQLPPALRCGLLGVLPLERLLNRATCAVEGELTMRGEHRLQQQLSRARVWM